MIKNYFLFGLVLFTAIIVFTGCSNPPAKNKIRGNWHSGDNKITLKITAKDFILDEGEPVAENYFVKGDTIFTLYEGSQPFTKFEIRNLSDKSLTLVYPDSTLVKFIR